MKGRERVGVRQLSRGSLRVNDGDNVNVVIEVKVVVAVQGHIWACSLREERDSEVVPRGVYMSFQQINLAD